jgi:hypothetical protein
MAGVKDFYAQRDTLGRWHWKLLKTASTNWEDCCLHKRKDEKDACNGYSTEQEALQAGEARKRADP